MRTLCDDLCAEVGSSCCVCEFHLECFSIQRHKQIHASFTDRRLERRVRSSTVGIAGQQIVSSEVGSTPLSVFVQLAGIDVRAGGDAALVRCEGNLRL